MEIVRESEWNGDSELGWKYWNGDSERIGMEWGQ